MRMRILLVAAAAMLLASSSGCCWWRHCWGSWAYYGCENTYGYCDGCPDGCGHGCTPILDCLRSHHGGGCGGCGGGYYRPADCCEPQCDQCAPCCEPCGHSCHLFHSPGPVGCIDCAHGGCGEKYCCDWINCPPCPDPCDCCGNYCGCKDPCDHYYLEPRPGSVPLHPHGMMHGGGGEYIEE